MASVSVQRRAERIHNNAQQVFACTAGIRVLDGARNPEDSLGYVTSMLNFIEVMQTEPEALAAHFSSQISRRKGKAA